MSWETVVGTAVVSSALTFATSTLAARRSAADARRHWAQAAKFRESSERLLHAADAYSEVAMAELTYYWGAGPSKAFDHETLDKAFKELSAALRALRLDADDKLLPVLDEIAWRARRMRLFARGTFGAISPEDFQRFGLKARRVGVHPAFVEALSEFTDGARIGLGHSTKYRRRTSQVRYRG